MTGVENVVFIREKFWLENSLSLSPSFRLAQAIFEPYLFPYKPPTFSTPVIFHTCPPIKMEHTECSKTLAYKIQTAGNYPEESI